MSSKLEESVRDLKGSVETLIRMYEICKESRMPSVPVILDSYYFVKNGTLRKQKYRLETLHWHTNLLWMIQLVIKDVEKAILNLKNFLFNLEMEETFMLYIL